MPIDDSLELDNFETLTRETIPRPGEIPKISGFDIYGSILKTDTIWMKRSGRYQKTNVSLSRAKTGFSPIFIL